MPNSSFYSYQGSNAKTNKKIIPSKSGPVVSKNKSNNNIFDSISETSSRIVGSSIWFFVSIIIVLLWFVSGFVFGFTETWYLVIHTITSIVIFLTMALLHASQRKWEERMISFETHQEKVLELLEKDTAEIKEEIKYDLDDYEELLKKEGLALDSAEEDEEHEEEDEDPAEIRTDKGTNTITSLL